MHKTTNLKFAISLSGGIEEWVSALKIIDSSTFDKVELPGACLDAIKKSDSLSFSGNNILNFITEDKRNFEVISVTDIAPATISGEITDQNQAIVDNYIENIMTALDKLEQLGIERSTLNISPANAFGNEEKRVKQVKLLKRITASLLDKQLNLSIPVRIPPVANTNPETFPAFLRETMSPNIKLAINIHPHEIKNMDSMEKQLRPFRFLMDSISFIYEPEAGNFLVDKLLEPWFEVLGKYRFDGVVIFVPRTADIAIFSREIERISGIMEQNEISSS